MLLHKFLLTAVASRTEEIKQKLGSGVVKLNKTYLVDFDWNVHLALAGDAIAQCKEPLLLLSLDIEQSESGARKRLVLELTKTDLAKLIEQLESVNDEVMKLKF